MMNKQHLTQYLENTWMNGREFEIADVIQHNSGWESDVYSFTVKSTEKPNSSGKPETSATLDSAANSSNSSGKPEPRGTLDSSGKPSQSYILRLYQGPDAAQKAKIECDGMKRLSRAGYPVPHIFAVEFDAAILGKPFVIMEKIAGPTLGAAMRGAERGERDRLFNAFLQRFVDLHNLDWEPFTDHPHAFLDNPYEGVDRFLNSARVATEKFGVTELHPVLDWFAARRHQVPCQRPSVIHWDFHPENVLVRGDGEMSVIDWTQIEVSDFRFDVAWTLLVASDGRPEVEEEAMLSGYQQISGRTVEHLEFFEAAVLVKRLMTMLITLRFGAEVLGMRADAREIMAANMDYIHALYRRLCEVTALPLPELGLTIQDLREGESQ